MIYRKNYFLLIGLLLVQQTAQAMHTLARSFYHTSCAIQRSHKPTRDASNKLTQNVKKRFVKDLCKLHGMKRSSINNFYTNQLDISGISNLCSYNGAPESLRNEILCHPIKNWCDSYLHNQLLCQLARPSWHLLTTVRFITQDTALFDTWVHAIANEIGRKVLVIKPDNKSYENFEVACKEFIMHHSKTFINAIKKDFDQPLIIVVHLSNSAVPVSCLEVMIERYASHSSSILQSKLQNTLIIQTAPHSLKKEAASPSPFYTVWQNEIVLK